MKTQGYIRLISSIDNNKNSVLELNILPNEELPGMAVSYLIFERSDF